MMVYVKNTHRTKKRSAKSIALAKEWDARMSKYDVKPGPKGGDYKPKEAMHRITPYYESLDTRDGNCNKVAESVYTGDAVVGISTMHKSNMVPVFSVEEAETHAKMRRG